MKNELQKLMQKNMDRQEFLKHVGVGFAAIVGITGALKAISSLGAQTQDQPPVGSYGASAYGGKPASTALTSDRKIRG